MKNKTQIKARSILIPVLILVLIIGGIVLYWFWNRTIFNDSPVYGNTAGNFYNGGLFCEANGYVYFANPSDKNRLYRMLPDGSQVEMLSEDSVECINADSHYIYYARANSTSRQEEAFSFLNFNTDSLCRVNLKGKHLEILDSAPTLYATLVGNTIYYIHYDTTDASTLYRVGIDKKDRRMVTKEPLLLSPGQQGALCFAGVSSDHNISLWNPDTDSSSVIYMGVAYQPIDHGDYVYFMDGENDYHLSRYDKATGDVTDLTGCRIDCYNITREYLYYQKNQEGVLCRQRLDGSAQEETVMSGNFTSIHATSQYVYFCDFHDPGSYHRTSADGPVGVSGFYPKSNSDN